MTSYTYLIGWSRLDLWYYGVRFAKGCTPEDLWVKYFTSSNRVASLRKEIGEPDVIQVRRVFADKKKAQAWELRVLKRMKVVKSPRWLNANDFATYHHTEAPSAELIARRGEAIKKKWDEMTEEARQARINKRRDAWSKAFAAKTDEERNAFREKSAKTLRERVNSTPNQLEYAKKGAAARQAKIDAMSEEERKAYFQSQTKNRVASRMSKSEEALDATRAKLSATWANKSDSEMAERARKHATTRAANIAKLREDELSALKEKRSTDAKARWAIRKLK